MRWYWVLLLVVLAGLAGYGIHWYNSSIDCPMCLCTKGALQPAYVEFWAYVKEYGLIIIVGVGFIGLTLAVALIAIWSEVVAVRKALTTKHPTS